MSCRVVVMAQHQLGDGREAQQTYDRALAWLQANWKSVEGTPLLAGEVHRFQTEVQELLKERPEKK